jgi:predicted kinase
VRETHISWVFLAGELAYKLKKPLALDFVDYSTPTRRHQMCTTEVQLNRRLAPDIYLGVRGVAETDRGVELTLEDDPRAVDFVVEMRRYDERRTLAAELGRGELRSEEIEAIGRRLARFHADVRPVEAASAPLLAVERQFERNLHDLLASVEQRAEIGRVRALERFAHAFIAGHAQTFQRRARSGRIRDVHGDLRAEHVLLDGDVRIVDCVEFDAALRELDVADDLAVLVLTSPRAAPNGSGRYSSAPTGARAETRATMPWWRSTRPIAPWFARRSHLSTDLTRKQLLRVPATQRASSAAYTAEWHARTYAELGRRAVQELSSLRGVIVDGTFRHRADRDSFADSFDGAAPVLFIECRAPRSVLRHRAGLRQRDPMHVSDADEAVVAREAGVFDPLDEVPARAHVALRTDRPVDEIVNDALALLDQRLPMPH